MSVELLETARRLAEVGPRRPRQADLKRAVSTAHYALFHGFAKNAADMLAGTGADRSLESWLQAYRAIEHGFARTACQNTAKLGFPEPIVRCAILFIELQERRHAADYDPLVRFTRAEALEIIDQADLALQLLQKSPRRDRRAFAIQLLLRRRA